MLTPAPATVTKPRVSIRNAIEATDLDAITNVTLAGFPSDPQWYYRFPYRKEYPEDHYKYSKERLGAYFSQVQFGRLTYHVAEAEEVNGKKVVAYAIWQMPGSHLPGPNEMQYPAPQPQRRDMNRSRHEAFFSAVNEGKVKHFDSRFGERQLYLSALCVDPAYQGRGVGKALIRWGINLAKKEKLGITLMASPEGYKGLYSRVGFKVGFWTIAQVPGDDEYDEFPGMYWVESEGQFPVTNA